MRIAFGPFMRSGKDTACEWLKETYGGKIFRFSHKLYRATEEVQKTLKLPVEKDRDLLLMIGKYANNKNPFIFVEQVLEKILEQPEDMNIFIPDVRREEEARMLKKHGFILVKITRESERAFCEMEERMSKSGLFDMTIENNGTLEDFLRSLDKIF